MRTKSIILSSSGLKNIVSGSRQDDEFQFIFKDNVVSMSTIFAEFISPKVSKMHQTDPTISNVNFNDELQSLTIDEEVITKFRHLSHGETILINESELFDLKIISNLIENEELSNKIEDIFSHDNSEDKVDRCLIQMTRMIGMNKASSRFDFISTGDMIDFISSHFCSIGKDKLIHFPKEVLHSIVTNPKLKLESEDSLFEFIKQIFNDENDDDDREFNIMAFLEKIELKNLSEEKLKELIEMISPSSISNEIWPKLCECFYFNKSNSNLRHKQNSRYQKVASQNFSYNGQFFEGIIDYLTKVTGSNVSENGKVKVTSSSTNGNKHVASNTVDLHDIQSFFYSQGQPNSWLKYDFGELKVHPTHYSIRTRHDSNCNLPRNWVIEGTNVDSDDDKVWKRLDSRQKDTFLQGVNASHTYDITEHIEPDESFRYLRLRQTGHNSNNLDYLTISALEFYGTLS